MRLLRLSVEEMAYLLGLLGGEQEAGEFLRTILGEVEPKELTGRLLSAAHSLLARGWLVLVDGELRSLDPHVQMAVGGVLQSHYSLRFSKTVSGEEAVVTYFFKEPLITEYRIEQAVVCCLEAIPDWDTVLNRSIEFMQVPEGDQASVLGTLSADLLQRAREQAETGRKDDAVELLEQGGLSSFARPLAEDMAGARWRGSVLKFRPSPKNVVSDQGFLVLQGARQMWLFEITGQSDLVVLPGNRRNFCVLLEKMRE